MMNTVFSRIKWTEPLFRSFINSHEKLKSYLMKFQPKANNAVIESLDVSQVEEYRRCFYSAIEKVSKNFKEGGHIYLIHSSMEGLQRLNQTPKEIIANLFSILGDKNTTFVMPTFPIETLKRREPSYIRKYNVKKSLCWTGMMPNVFMKMDGCVRSSYPYNTLAAIGPHANKMFNLEKESVNPHDKYSAWYYCYENHATILFLGTTSIKSNTMLNHMLPDVMGDLWPIKQWYRKQQYEVTNLDQSKKLMDIEIQGGDWHNYFMSHYVDRWARKKGLLQTLNNNIKVEMVPDCRAMLDAQINEFNKGTLPFCIPKRFWKKGDDKK